MRLTPDMLVATYDRFKTCEPFRRWKLPDSDDVVFEVTHRRHEYGDYCDQPQKISASAVKNETLHELDETVAHEMVHQHLYLIGYRSWHKHGALFKRKASLVCRKLGFDPSSF